MIALNKLGWAGVLCSAVALAACGGDDSATPVPVPLDGGGDGAAHSDAGTGDAGAGDATTPVHPDGGARDGATDAELGDATRDATTDAGVVPESVVVATTDYPDGTSEVATIDLAAGALVRSTSFPDKDVVPLVRGGQRFAFQRTNDVLEVLDDSGFVTKSIHLRAVDGGSASLDPHDLAILPGTSTAFVSLYSAGAIAVVDLVGGTVTARIDLTSFTDASDGDGSPDVDALVYVPETGLIYATLQRIDRTLYPIACPTWKSLIVAIDPTTLAVTSVQADAGAATTIPLKFVSPGSVVYDAAQTRLLVLSNGCTSPTDGGGTRAFGGIESVPLTGATLGTTTALYTQADQNFLDDLVVLGTGRALVESFDPSFATLWNLWDLASPTLGAPVAGIPDNAVFEDGDTVLGTARHDAPGDGGAGGAEDGYSVVRYAISTGKTTTVFTNASAAFYSFVDGVALAR